MSEAMEVKLCLKVMINKQKSKVLFAVADNYFTDVLLSFLTLPLGKIVRILEKHYGDKPPVFGSITSLYNGFANLEDTYFSTPVAKRVLRNPAVPLGPQCWKLKLNITESKPPTYFICSSGRSCPHKTSENVSMYCGVSTCDCGKVLNTKVNIPSDSYNGDDGVLITSKTASFIISDDLRILPNVIGNIQALNRLGVEEADMDGAELRDVAFGPNEIVELLVECLISPTPLSNLVLNKKKVGFAANPLAYQIKQEENSNSKKKIVVTVCVQKSSNKLLFAQADDDFVELLSSFLIIPLGGVASLLKGNTCHKNIDNLYTSLTNGINDKYLQSSDTKTKLIKPKLSHGYISKNQFLPLQEETAPQLLYYDLSTGTFGSPNYKSSCVSVRLKSPIGKLGSYVKESTTYILTDALTVAPFCITSGLAIINQMNIPSSDIDFLDVEVGVEEALSVLKASLTSTSALTDGLMNPRMMKRPKTEN